MKNIPNKFSNARELLTWLGAREFPSDEILQEYDIENSFDEFNREIYEGRNYWMQSEDRKSLFYIYDFEYILIVRPSDASPEHVKILLISVNKLKSECVGLCSLAHFMIHEDYKEINCSNSNIDRVVTSISLINLIKLSLLDSSYGNIQFRFNRISESLVNVGLLSDAGDLDSRINLCLSLTEKEGGGVKAKVIPAENFDSMYLVDDFISYKLNLSNFDKTMLQGLLNRKKLPWKLNVNIERLDVGAAYLDDTGEIYVTSGIKTLDWDSRDKRVQIELSTMERFLKSNNGDSYDIALEERYDNREVIFLRGAFWFEYGYGKNGRFVDRIIPSEDIIRCKKEILSEYESVLKYLWVCDRPSSRSLRPALRLVINEDDIRREYEAKENVKDDCNTKMEVQSSETIADKIPFLARLLNLR